jgi:predicted RND superfamily exporter protein
MPAPLGHRHTADFIVRMGDRFARQAPMIVRRRWIIIMAVALLTAVMVPGVLGLEREDSLECWLLENDPLYVAQEEFARTFGNSDYVLVLAEADDVFTDEVLAMLRDLEERLEEMVPYADEALSIAGFEFAIRDRFGVRSQRLVPEVIPSDPERLEAIRARALGRPSIAGRLFSEDGTQAIVMLGLTEYPSDGSTENEHQRLVAHAVRDILQDERFADYRLTAGGLPILNSEMTEWLDRENPRLFALTLLAMIVILGVLFRSVRCVIAPLLTAVVSTVWVFGVMGYAGIRLYSVVEIIPVVLVLVVSIGYSIHVLSFFRERFRSSGSRPDAISFALEHAGWPVLFTVITTVLGLASFAAVRVSAVRWIGLVSAGLVICAYPLVIVMTPALLSFGEDREPDRERGRRRADRVGDLLVALSDWVAGHGRAIMMVFFILLAVFAFLTSGLEITTDSIKTMGRRVPYIRSSQHIAEGIGSLYAYDVTVALPDSGTAITAGNIEKLVRLTGSIEQADFVKRTTSMVHILKEAHQVATDGGAGRFRIPEDSERLAQLIALYKEAGSPGSEIWTGDGGRVLRVSVELERFSTGEMVRHLRSVAKLAKELYPGAEVNQSGLSVQFSRVADQMVRGQILSVVAAMVSISLVLMLALGSVRLGLIAMIPNIAPVIFVTGTMAVLDIPLHQMTVIIAPLIIGIAVDDTIHYITHFRVAFQRLGSYEEASRDTFRSVGRAIFMTSLVIIIGFAMLMTSVANAYRHIALATIVGVAVALAADYLVTPTLIRGLKVFGAEK